MAPGPNAMRHHATESGRSFRTLLVAIVGAALGVRVLYTILVAPSIIGFGDYQFYQHGANLLAEGHGFAHPTQVCHGTSAPAAFQPALWPMLRMVFSALGAKPVLIHKLVGAGVGPA